MTLKPGPVASPPRTNDLDAFWVPFTANRRCKRSPRLFGRAEGMPYLTDDGRRVLDGTSGLWCFNASHCRPHIVVAIRRQARELDFAGAPDHHRGIDELIDVLAGVLRSVVD